MNIPTVWIDTLKRVQKVCPTAILGGGCLRDFDMGITHKVKDIDIFIQVANGDEFERAVMQIFTEFDLKGQNWRWGHSNGDYPENEIFVDQMSFNTPNGTLAINIIGLNLESFNEETVAESFDFGICQITWAGRDPLVYMSKSYLNDRKNYTFTLDMKNRYQVIDYNRSMARWERLSQKFPAWKLNIINDELVKS